MNSKKCLETIQERKPRSNQIKPSFLMVKKINFNNGEESKSKFCKTKNCSSEKQNNSSVDQHSEKRNKFKENPNTNFNKNNPSLLLNSFRINKFKNSNCRNKNEFNNSSKNLKLSTSVSKLKNKERNDKNLKNKEILLPLINNKLPLKENSPSNKVDKEKAINIKKINHAQNEEGSGSTSKISPKLIIKLRTHDRNSNKTTNSCKSKEKEKEDLNDRYNSVRKSFIDKKLHIFNNEKLYYFIVLPGNSSYLLKNCMNHRSNWRECQSAVTTLFNFKWQQNVIGIDYASLSRTIKQTVNHYEFHNHISNKCNLLINLMKYCETKGLEVFNYVPFTVLFQYESASYVFQMDNFTNLYNNIKDYTFSLVSPPQGLNLTESHLYNKDSNKIKKYSSLFNLYGCGNEKTGNRTSIVINPNHYDGKNFWIVKACDLNRGRCIKMADSIFKVQKLLKKFYDGIPKVYTNEDEDLLNSNKIYTEDEKRKLLTNKYRTNSVIVQKYIEKPMLYKGRKFDVRIWVLITHKFEVYVFKEGHLKTSSVLYDINISNSYVHITNYSIQKYNENFSKFEQGNEVSFADFQLHLDETAEKPVNVRIDIFSKMKEIIEITFRAVQNKININERKNCFELFGYDFIVDIDLNVFLLEINSNPGLEESSQLIKSLVPRMLDDALRLTIDELYDTKYTFGCSTFSTSAALSNDDKKEYQSPYNVIGYNNSENLWELVCDLNEKDKIIGKRRKLNK